MEKIENLFNQRLDETEGPNHAKLIGIDDMNRVFRMNNGCEFCFEFVFSKRFLFVKWLVDNDKIDFRILEEKERRQDIDITFYNELTGFFSDNEKWIIMLLSVQDNPIRFLNSVLK